MHFHQIFSPHTCNENHRNSSSLVWGRAHTWLISYRCKGILNIQYKEGHLSYQPTIEAAIGQCPCETHQPWIVVQGIHFICLYHKSLLVARAHTQSLPLGMDCFPMNVIFSNSGISKPFPIMITTNPS